MNEAQKKWDGNSEDERITQTIGKAVVRASAQGGRGRRSPSSQSAAGKPDTNYIESGALTPASDSVRARTLFAAKQSARRASRTFAFVGEYLAFRVKLMELRRHVARVAGQPVRRQAFDDAANDARKLGETADQREFGGIAPTAPRTQCARRATSPASALRKTEAIRAWPYRT